MNAPVRQSGAALLISLVLLLLLTVIAIAAAYQASLQTRMAANSQQQNTAFQAAESGISAWVKAFQSDPQIIAKSTSGNLDSADRVPFEVEAPTPGNCVDTIPAYSLNAAQGDSSFQYACFNIESRAKSCADSNCNDVDNPARAEHHQGHLVRY